MIRSFFVECNAFSISISAASIANDQNSLFKYQVIDVTTVDRLLLDICVFVVPIEIPIRHIQSFSGLFSPIEMSTICCTCVRCVYVHFVLCPCVMGYKDSGFPYCYCWSCVVLF